MKYIHIAIIECWQCFHLSRGLWFINQEFLSDGESVDVIPAPFWDLQKMF